MPTPLIIGWLILFPVAMIVYGLRQYRFLRALRKQDPQDELLALLREGRFGDSMSLLRDEWRAMWDPHHDPELERMRRQAGNAYFACIVIGIGSFALAILL